MSTNERVWINPIGGYGDMLMLAGVLKLAHDHDPAVRYNLVRRTKYLTVFSEHPAIDKIGYPPKGAQMAQVDYWMMEKLGADDQRPFQILARAFGLQTPVEEKLYIPNEHVEDKPLHEFLPWKKLNIIVAPGSESPRKEFNFNIWHRLVDLLLADGMFVMQAGILRHRHIRNTYSLLGLTTHRQLLALIKKCDLVITVDNFLMHACHLVGKPAVVVWGATNHRVYGYPEQIHLQMPKACGLPEFEDCIGPTRNEGGKLYGTPCPQKERHCLDQAKPQQIYQAAKKALIR